MSKKDRVKTKLDLLKSLILGFMTALFGVVATLLPIEMGLV